MTAQTGPFPAFLTHRQVASQTAQGASRALPVHIDGEQAFANNQVGSPKIVGVAVTTAVKSARLQYLLKRLQLERDWPPTILAVP